MWNFLRDRFVEETHPNGRKVTARAVVGYCDRSHPGGTLANPDRTGRPDDRRHAGQHDQRVAYRWRGFSGLSGAGLVSAAAARTSCV